MFILIDHYSKMIKLYLLTTKDEAYQKFIEFEAECVRQFGVRIKTVRSDGGGEFTSTLFKEYLKTLGIRQELTVPRTPQQNGVV